VLHFIVDVQTTATIMGDAAGSREPVTTQQIRMAQRDRIRVRRVRPEAFRPAGAA
jgi:hypothetical protein